MMQQRDWAGVFPAITTPFRPDLSVDHEALTAHVRWLIDSGCTGIVALGSLGETQTLSADERVEVLATCRRALPSSVPVIAGVAGLSTIECVALTRRAADVGCDGIMALPVYVYRGDWRETKAHYSAVIAATLIMSSGPAPRERSEAGRARPCSTGPIALAPANLCTSL